MQAKTFTLPDTLTEADKAFMKRLTAEKNKRNEAIQVNGRQVTVVRRTME